MPIPFTAPRATRTEPNVVSTDPFPLYAAAGDNGFTRLAIHDVDHDREVVVGYSDGGKDVYVDVHHVVKFPDSYRLTFMSEPGETNAERISLPVTGIKYVKTGKLVGMRPDRKRKVDAK